MNIDEEMRKILQETWPDWEVVKELGRGSYGIVYQITHRDNIGTDAAAKVISIPQDVSEVKELQSEGQTMDEVRTYFKEVTDGCVRELTLMYSLKDQPNVVQIEDHKVVRKKGDVGWYILIREELLTSLKDYMTLHPMSEEDVIKLGMNICTALEACSKQHIIHRDIKPENLFISHNGVYKLGDFGIARKLENMTVSMSVKGTTNYMAPEIIRDPNYDATVDIYSLGLVMYRLMNKNKMPFIDIDKRVVSVTEREEATRRRIDGESFPPPCDASEGLSAIILKACAFDPAQRFQTATEMKKALANPDRFLASVTAASQDQDPAADTEPDDKAEVIPKTPVNNEQQYQITQSKKRRHIHPAVIAAIIVMAAAAVVALILYLSSGPDYMDVIKTVTLVPNSSNDTAEPTESSSSDHMNELIPETESPSIYDETSGGEENLPQEPLAEEAGNYAKEATEALAEAEEYADNGNYEEAIRTIKGSQSLYINDEDSEDAKALQDAYDMYEPLYKGQAINEAEVQENNGDYLSAIDTIEDGEDLIGENTDFTEKKEELEEKYVQDVVNQAEALMDEGDFTSADEILLAALQEFPENEALLKELDVLFGG